MSKDDCPQCTGATFDEWASTSFVNSSVADQVRYVDGDYVIGLKVRDALSVDMDEYFSVSNFTFLIGHATQGFEQEDGLIGLSRPRFSQYEQFVEKLFAQGKIDNDLFAFYMAN
jgi:hypothetical protein